MINSRELAHLRLIYFHEFKEVWKKTTSETFYEALKYFIDEFQLIFPKEASLIEKLLDSLSVALYIHSEELRSWGKFGIFLAINMALMLNTSLYNPAARARDVLTKEKFVSMPDQCEDVEIEKHYLEVLFDKISGMDGGLTISFE